jgi:hypothetical protein
LNRRDGEYDEHPSKVKDKEKNTANFLKSLSRIHFLKKPLSNPSIPPFLKGGKGGLII